MFMKKQLMGLAACALILSSCSQNQEIENYEQLNREEVRLAPYVNKSKASVMDPTALKDKGFKVFAVQHPNEGVSDYSGLPVSMSNIKESWNDNKWTHDGKYYWPESKALSFFMVAPYYDSSNPYLTDDANANLDITQGASMTLPVTIKDNVADQIDILAASKLNQTRTGPNAATVDFQFKHILSRIGFKASMDKEDNLKFKITGLKYSYTSDKVVSGGTYNYTPTITLNDNKHQGSDISIGLATQSVILDNISAAKTLEATLNNATSYLMILPQELKAGDIKVKVIYEIAVADGEAAYGDSKTAEISLPAQTYAMGKAYTHNLKFSKSSTGGEDLLEVTFGDVGVEEWDEQKPGDVNVPKPETQP